MINFFDPSKVKEIADDNFKFEENDWKFSKGVENTVEKGEIARYEQFLLFPVCFLKTGTADKLKLRACLGKGWMHPQKVSIKVHLCIPQL